MKSPFFQFLQHLTAKLSFLFLLSIQVFPCFIDQHICLSLYSFLFDLVIIFLLSFGIQFLFWSDFLVETLVTYNLAYMRCRARFAELIIKIGSRNIFLKASSRILSFSCTSQRFILNIRIIIEIFLFLYWIFELWWILTNPTLLAWLTYGVSWRICMARIYFIFLNDRTRIYFLFLIDMTRIYFIFLNEPRYLGITHIISSSEQMRISFKFLCLILWTTKDVWGFVKMWFQLIKMTHWLTSVFQALTILLECLVTRAIILKFLTVNFMIVLGISL